MLAPFATLEQVTAAVPDIVQSGIGPVVLEYIDALTMSAITANVGLDLGISKAVQDATLAYLVVVLENTQALRLDEDVAALGELLEKLGALDVYRPAAPGGRTADRCPGEGVLRRQSGRCR